MSDISVRIEGAAGRITLTRPQALNAVTYEMVQAIHAALNDWRAQDTVKLVIIDAEGEKAFSAGGDIADLYDRGTKGDFAYGQHFWADEYRMNAALHSYEKPVVSFLQGFTMGGGMGVGCHGSHRIVSESSQVSMPECGIGLVPDVGGSMILANAPGHIGAYLGTTGARMNAADAIHAGFADMFIAQSDWPALISQLELTADVDILRAATTTPTDGSLSREQRQIDTLFAEADLKALIKRLEAAETEFAQTALKAIRRASPLSVAVVLKMMQRLDGCKDIRDALKLEYRFTARAMEHGDFLEGIRAAIIDKDRTPRWKHDADSLSDSEVDAMLAPLDTDLKFD